MNTREMEALLKQDKEDTVLTIDQPNPFASLPEDVINLISQLLPYKKDLRNLRLSSKQMNDLIEQTPAGQIAREANKLDPAFLGKLITNNETGALTVGLVMGGMIGGGLVIGIGFASNVFSILDSMRMEIKTLDTFLVLVFVTMAVFAGMIIAGGALGCSFCNYSIYNSKNTLFENHQKQNAIRQPLSRPVTEFKYD